MYSHLRTALEKVAVSLRERLTTEIVSVIAFGSRVRGDHGPESDFDVLVVVRKRTPLVEREVMDVFVENELANGIPFDPVIKEATAFELERKHRSPFYESVMRDGIRV